MSHEDRPETLPVSRREVIGSVGTLAAAGGWLGLAAGEAQGQQAAGTPQQPYTLPPLPYGYDALEPHIDRQTLQLHHDRHHAAYVGGLNDALTRLAEVDRAGGEEALRQVRALTEALEFNASGHVLHSIYWTNMINGGGGQPAGELARLVTLAFGNFAVFQAHFSAAAAQIQGSGWAVLAWEPLGRRLVVVGTEKHQNGTFWGGIPLLVLDVWEHAYYLKYQNRRAEYIQAFWNLVNWVNVSDRLALAMRLSA